MSLSAEHHAPFGTFEISGKHVRAANYVSSCIPIHLFLYFLGSLFCSSFTISHVEISLFLVCLKLLPLDNHFSSESGKGFYHRVTEIANYSFKGHL